MPLKEGEEKKLDKNPRGQYRPKDGRGEGKGVPKGQRKGKNVESCPDDEGPGGGKGKGRGKGKSR